MHSEANSGKFKLLQVHSEPNCSCSRCTLKQIEAAPCAPCSKLKLLQVHSEAICSCFSLPLSMLFLCLRRKRHGTGKICTSFDIFSAIQPIFFGLYHNSTLFNVTTGFYILSRTYIKVRYSISNLITTIEPLLQQGSKDGEFRKIIWIPSCRRVSS